MHLVIGNSQLSKYFPNEEYIKISSRNIDFDFLKNNTWESVYITFAEQKIYETNIDYITPNYIYTLNIIETLLKNSNKIVCYTSCELWNNLSGYISLNSAPNFNTNNEYAISKLLLLNKIKERRLIDDVYNKVIFIHPFYFNSVYRSEYFLFGKIFDSIINRKKINVRSLDFYRDMIHTKFLVKKSIEQKNDCVVGSGKLFHVGNFIKDLYKLNELDFNYFVNQEGNTTSNKKLIMANVEWQYSYDNLLLDTINDIKENGDIWKR
jgi:hypothetical protein